MRFGSGETRFFGFAQHAANAGMGVLHIENRIVVALFRREIDIEVHGGVVAAHEIKEAGDVRADPLLFSLGFFRRYRLPKLVDKVPQLVDIPVPLPHGSGLTVLHESHDLENHDIEASLGFCQRRYASLSFGWRSEDVSLYSI